LCVPAIIFTVGILYSWMKTHKTTPLPVQ
jgi:hypothetical protein